MEKELKPYPTYAIAIWCAIFFGVLIWSGINPQDRFTWVLEVAPALIGFIILAATYKRFKFSALVYWLILAQCIVLMIGGHYTYAMTPIGEWMKEIFGFTRNHYDRIGHFMQGFVPALIAREIFVRFKIIKNKTWESLLVIFLCMSISVIYEFVEWGAALAVGESAMAFLGTQGDIWDTQMDMLLCTIGAIVSVLFLPKLHDKSMSKRKS